MKTILFTTLLALTSTQAFAGANNVILSCKSADGKIALTGNVPGNLADFNLDIKLATNGPQEVKLFWDFNDQTQKQEKNATIEVIDDLRNGVYTLASDEDTGLVSLRLYALPKTIKLHELGSGNLKSSFTAKISVYGDNVNADGNVTCTTDYEI